MSITREMRQVMARFDWHSNEWKQQEERHLRLIAWQAGWHAYQGPGWSNSAIRQEAARFLRENRLLSYRYTHEPAMLSLVFAHFVAAWYDHEKRSGQP